MTPDTTSQAQALRDYRDRLRDLPTPQPTRRAGPAKRAPFNPYRTLAVTFLALIAIGTLLLCSPWAQSDHCWAWLSPGRPFTWAKVAEALIDNPALLNEAPYDAWLIKVSGAQEVGELLDAAGYEAVCKAEEA